MIRTDSARGRIALMVAHCAGMVDLVALPVWVGTLISRYRLDPQQAGLLATLFLVGAVLASVVLAPLFHRLPGRTVATLGFGLAGAGFFAVSRTADFGTMALLHALSGVAAGAALSVTHGTIARSANPHRLFAIVGMALGVFAIVFLGATPQVVASVGGPALFVVFAGVMGVATLVSLLAFPAPDAAPAGAGAGAGGGGQGGIPAAVWFGIAGIAGMGLVQSMTFSFLERVGADRGFGPQAVTGVLIALGFVNLFPAVLAALLEKRWAARTVLLVGPVLQALLVATIMNATAFVPYAVAASLFAAVMIFTHTFAFGLLARLDTSGRAMAATPAMVMIGAAIGPILGGTLVKAHGYGSLGLAALFIAALAVFCFSRIPAQTAVAPRQEALA
ncbi:MFS transporter [Rubrivivax rivuli]|uniref:MFS transporter n=1 Tax=Rubrivivax rivuli TaxID=1862385 RepID=A0A437RAK2_9BURK|nr:MFS transporter [Rubrivivax rivuli]RVU43714.1 MFS transporter [Rubrivivax rivuli]